eukprot:1148191-Pelagomonas_calceolata.AAC.4
MDHGKLGGISGTYTWAVVEIVHAWKGQHSSAQQTETSHLHHQMAGRFFRQLQRASCCIALQCIVSSIVSHRGLKRKVSEALQETLKIWQSQPFTN